MSPGFGVKIRWWWISGLLNSQPWTSQHLKNRRCLHHHNLQQKHLPHRKWTNVPWKDEFVTIGMISTTSNTNCDDFSVDFVVSFRQMIEGFRFQRSCNHIHISIIGLASMLCWLSFPHHVFVTNYASNELPVRLLYANLVSGFNHQTQIGSFPQVGIKIPKNIKKHRSNHLVLKLSRDILLFPIKTPKNTVVFFGPPVPSDQYDEVPSCNTSSYPPLEASLAF